MKNETRQAWLWHYMVQNLFWVMFGLIMGSSVYAYDIQSSKLSIHLKYTSVGGSVPSQFVTSNAVATLAGPVSSNYDPAMFACRLTSLPAEVFACKVVHYNPITSVHTLQVRTWDWLSAVEKHNSAAAGTIFSFLHRVETVCEPYGLGHVYEDSLMGLPPWRSMLQIIGLEALRPDVSHLVAVNLGVLCVGTPQALLKRWTSNGWLKNLLSSNYLLK